MTKTPEIAVFSMLLLGNDFLAASLLLSGESWGRQVWVPVGVFGLALLWFIIRREPLWKDACLVSAGTASYLGIPLGLFALVLCRPGHSPERPRKERLPEADSALRDILRKRFAARRLPLNDNRK